MFDGEGSAAKECRAGCKSLDSHSGKSRLRGRALSSSLRSGPSLGFLEITPFNPYLVQNNDSQFNKSA